jgi:hypothetical protein
LVLAAYLDTNLLKQLTANNNVIVASVIKDKEGRHLVAVKH